MNKEVLYVLLPDYAAHEMVYLSEAIASDEFALKENPKYVNKVVAPTLEPVKSIGGFRVIPDYSFDTMPEDYAALVPISSSRVMPGLWGIPEVMTTTSELAVCL